MAELAGLVPLRSSIVWWPGFRACPANLKVKRLQKRYLFARISRTYAVEVIKRRRVEFGVGLDDRIRACAIAADTCTRRGHCSGAISGEFVEELFRKYESDDTSYYVTRSGLSGVGAVASPVPGPGSDGEGMKVIEIQRESELQALRTAWNGVLASAVSNTVFLTWEWVTAWWSYIRKTGRTPGSVAADDDGAIVGIAPLRRHTLKKYGQTVPLFRL